MVGNNTELLLDDYANLPVVSFDANLGRYVNNVDVDLEKLSLAMEDAGIPRESLKEFSIHFNSYSRRAFGAFLIKKGKWARKRHRKIIKEHGFADHQMSYDYPVTIQAPAVFASRVGFLNNLPQDKAKFALKRLKTTTAGEMLGLTLAHEIKHASDDINGLDRPIAEDLVHYGRASTGVLAKLGMLNLTALAAGELGAPILENNTAAWASIGAIALGYIANRSSVERMIRNASSDEKSAYSYAFDSMEREEDNPWSQVVTYQ